MLLTGVGEGCRSGCEYSTKGGVKQEVNFRHPSGPRVLSLRRNLDLGTHSPVSGASILHQARGIAGDTWRGGSASKVRHLRRATRHLAGTHQGIRDALGDRYWLYMLYLTLDVVVPSASRGALDLRLSGARDRKPGTYRAPTGQALRPWGGSIMP